MKKVTKVENNMYMLKKNIDRKTQNDMSRPNYKDVESVGGRSNRKKSKG